MTFKKTLQEVPVDGHHIADLGETSLEKLQMASPDYMRGACGGAVPDSLQAALEFMQVTKSFHPQGPAKYEKFLSALKKVRQDVCSH